MYCVLFEIERRPFFLLRCLFQLGPLEVTATREVVSEFSCHPPLWDLVEGEEDNKVVKRTDRRRSGHVLFTTIHAIIYIYIIYEWMRYALVYNNPRL